MFQKVIASSPDLAVSSPQPNTPEVHQLVLELLCVRSYLFLLLMWNQELAVNEVFSRHSQLIKDNVDHVVTGFGRIDNILLSFDAGL
jgi:hypothetical protein